MGAKGRSGYASSSSAHPPTPLRWRGYVVCSPMEGVVVCFPIEEGYVISNVVRNLKDEIPPPYGRRNDVLIGPVVSLAPHHRYAEPSHAGRAPRSVTVRAFRCAHSPQSAAKSALCFPRELRFATPMGVGLALRICPVVTCPPPYPPPMEGVCDLFSNGGGMHSVLQWRSGGLLFPNGGGGA